VTVGVGQLEDYVHCQGIAHFLEHMLFLGTKKYPNADYDDWLGKNAGFSNAYTDNSLTNYYFEVKNSAFEEAIDRFSSFFSCALFNSDLTQREMNAVNSEFAKNL
jgi:insulysin